VFLNWPFGHPLGEPFNEVQQRAVLMSALQALYAIESPGGIIDLPFRWRRHDHEGYMSTERFKELTCWQAA
jgi:D-proline reductase (dithiol) PrdB